MTGFEPLIGAAVAGLGGLITSLVKDKGTETLKKLDWDIGRNLALRKALNEYVIRYVKRHGTLKVVCVRMDNPVRLDEIYTAVELLDRWQASQYFADEAALQTQYRKSGKRGFSVTDTKKKPGLQVANEEQYLMVLGGPGVGKSTFLRKVGLEALNTLGRSSGNSNPKLLESSQSVGYRHPCIPVMLELRQFDQPDRSIKTVIAEELNNCGFPEAEALTELFLRNGKLLVLLDGLDEVPSAALNHAITEIKNLVDTYSTNRFIASCRVAAYTFGGFTRFKDVAMAAFEDKQIQQFIQNWFQKDRDSNTAERCWELLNSKDYQAAKELAQTPLLLTLLCVVYDDYQDFPKKRHALYGEALDVLLRKWAAEKRIQRNPIYQELSAELELDMLAEIAYTSFVDDQLFFSKTSLIHQIRDFLVDNLNAPRHLDAETVLKEIEIQQGILVERARDAYSFSHLTFQEYLTAKCIVDNNKIDQLVRDHATEQNWREVFLLVAGLCPGKKGTDDLLIALEKQTQANLFSSNLREIINWSRKITTSTDGKVNSKAKCTAAILLARVIDSSINDAKEIIFKLQSNPIWACNVGYDSQLLSMLEINLRGRFEEHRRALAAFDKKLDFDTTLAYKYRNMRIIEDGLINEFISSLRELERNILRSNQCADIEKLNIFPGFSRFSELDRKYLQDYFYLIELMIRCKESAVRGSPQVWAGIEERMVTVPKE